MIGIGPHRVVTCYLKLEPRDRIRGKYLIKLKNRIKAAARGLEAWDLSRASREAVDRDLRRIQDYLKSPAHLPATQGLALFASEPLGLFETVALPRVHRSRLAVDRFPQVREIVSAEDEFGRVLAVALDRTAARFFEVTAFGARELASLRAGAPLRGSLGSDAARENSIIARSYPFRSSSRPTSASMARPTGWACSGGISRMISWVA